MSKNLVAYFSCTGTTKGLAEKLVKVTGGDLFEIKPKEEYTASDLNWRDKSSRSSLEMNDKSSRPEILDKVDNMEEYDTVFLGFPIWWYTAPRIINTFLESYDFSNKKIIVFCTSGGSGLGNTISDLKPSCSSDAKWLEGKRFPSNVSSSELEEWVNSLKE